MGAIGFGVNGKDKVVHILLSALPDRFLIGWELGWEWNDLR